jgi:hypothetical protein
VSAATVAGSRRSPARTLKHAVDASGFSSAWKHGPGQRRSNQSSISMTAALHQSRGTSVFVDPSTRRPVDPSTGEPWEYSRPAAVFLRQAYEDAGLRRPGVMWHAVRHTYASVLATGGVRRHELAFTMMYVNDPSGLYYI